MESKYFYEFGPFRVDSKKRLLVRDGKRIRLRPKAFLLLMLFLDKPEELHLASELVKEKEEEGKEVLGKKLAFSDENNLSKHIGMVRKALGDKGYEYIETVPGQGYRFLAEVKKVPVEEERSRTGTDQERNASQSALEVEEERKRTGVPPASSQRMPSAMDAGPPQTQFSSGRGDADGGRLLRTLKSKAFPRIAIAVVIVLVAAFASFSYLGRRSQALHDSVQTPQLGEPPNSQANEQLPVTLLDLWNVGEQGLCVRPMKDNNGVITIPEADCPNIWTGGHLLDTVDLGTFTHVKLLVKNLGRGRNKFNLELKYETEYLTQPGKIIVELGASADWQEIPVPLRWSAPGTSKKINYIAFSDHFEPFQIRAAILQSQIVRLRKI